MPHRVNNPSIDPSAIVDQYPDAVDRYDEMFAAPHQARPHWQAMLSFLAQSSPDAMLHRVKTVQKQVQENGVTYNVYADPRGTDRPWDLDVVPMILPASEWATIEAAVIQRATLLNKILLDIYGDQQLLKQGHLPASLIHGHAGFLRACHGIKHRDEIALHTYAVDLARSPDGHWWAVTDRTQSPSGAGYALENRLVIARAFPEMFRDLNVQRLAGFFAALRDSLTTWGRACVPYQGLALADNERPLIVLLTPGPYNETYYEQAYLARYLGFPLIQGSDLTVRDGFVWLKTLSGLQRVHAILRRLDDDFCDPLELRADSMLGVAGLTEAARRGTVLIANSLGSNVIESSAMLGFLPKLSKHLLGEPLKMPSVATWWCGEPAALEDAIENLDHLIFKPTFPQLRQLPVFGDALDAQQRSDFIKQLRAHPQNYVAQELVQISQVPVWKQANQNPNGEPGNSLGNNLSANNGSYNSSHAGLGASAVGIRVFACATPNGYVVMPGGLTRVATGSDSRVTSMQRGGGSKDTWVITNEPINDVSLIPKPTSSAELIRGDTHLASRTVENLFWYGRNVERCDNTTRLLRRAFDSLIETSPDARGPDWQTVIALCQWHELLADDTELDDASISERLLEAMHSSEVPGLANNIQQLFRGAFNLRERLSGDNWRSLNKALAQLGKPDPELSISDALALLDEATVSLMTLTGFALDGMTRDMGWRFLAIGRRIERLQFMSSVIQHALAMPSSGRLEWLLELGDSIITYRSRYMAQPEWLPALDLLLLDGSNPRSVIYQLVGLHGSMIKVAALHGECGQELIAPLLNELRALDPSRDLNPGGERLLGLMRNIYAMSYQLSERLNTQFFSYTGTLNDKIVKSH